MGLHDALRESLTELGGGRSDTDAALALVGDAEIVLLGEATHGTHEFYELRARLTQRLIEEKGFHAVAVEADWPHAARVGRWVRGQSDEPDAASALDGFERFPTWMWRNTVVRSFVTWLRQRNLALPPAKRAGFYGLDLYSLYDSMQSVIEYLDRRDPEAARSARRRYACFDHLLEDDGQRYGRAVGTGAALSCESEVVAELLDLRRRREQLLLRDGRDAEDAQFEAEQNAHVVKNAEAYYRSMVRWDVSSWNLRDLHMADTLDALIDHLSDRRSTARVVVWAHNSHLGDASATEMSRRGETNLGEIARNRHGEKVISIGFTTHRGWVTAASDWGSSAERKRVRPALAGSHELLFHELSVPRFFLSLRDLGEAAGQLREERLERAIGVVYRPETERRSHYFSANLPAQFDGVFHLDETSALEPLERQAHWARGEPPETFPSGM